MTFNIEHIIPKKVEDQLQKMSDSRLTTVAYFGYEAFTSTQEVTSALWTKRSVTSSYFINDLTRTFFQIANEYREINRAIHFVETTLPWVGITTIPFGMHGVFHYTRNLFMQEDIAESGVYLGQYLGWLATSTIGVLKTAGDLSLFSFSTREWLHASIHPLSQINIASYGLSLTAHIYGLHENFALMKKTASKIQKMDEKTLKEVFHVEGSAIKHSLNNNFKGTIEVLKGRIASKIQNHRLNILAISILGIGLAILTYSGFQVAAGTISITGSVINLAAMVYELNEESKLEKFLCIAQNEYKKHAITIGVLSLFSIPLLVTGKVVMPN